MYVCVCVLFQGEGKLVVEHLPAHQRCQGPEHRGPLWTNVRMSDIYYKCAWKSSEQRNNVASYWLYKNHSGYCIEIGLKEVRGDTGRPVWKHLGCEVTRLRLGWWQRR